MNVHAAHARITPLGGERFRLDATLDHELHELLSEARDLLGHAVPGGGLVEVLRYCVRRTVTGLRRRKCGASAQHRPARRAAANARHIPAQVRDAVWARDGGHRPQRDGGSSAPNGGRQVARPAAHAARGHALDTVAHCP